MDYKASGVDIDAGNEAVRRIRGLARSTFTTAVLSDIGFQRIHFFKNVSLIGGLIMLATFGPGPVSLDRR